MVIGVIENVRDALKAGVGVTKEAMTDPLVALYAKWRGLEWRRVPEGMADAEAETFNAQSADLADEVSIEIISASPDTLIGTFAQMALLRYWVKNRAPFRAEAALEKLSGRIETALQDAAA